MPVLLALFSDLELEGQVQASPSKKCGGAGAMSYSHRQILMLR